VLADPDVPRSRGELNTRCLTTTRVHYLSLAPLFGSALRVNDTNFGTGANERIHTSESDGSPFGSAASLGRTSFCQLQARQSTRETAPLAVDQDRLGTSKHLRGLGTPAGCSKADPDRCQENALTCNVSFGA